jgi:hypothetical protein
MIDHAENEPDARCPRCGDAALGRFCAGCGAAVRDVSCTSCGRALAAGARFCNSCGAAAVPGDGRAAGRRTSSASISKLAGGAAFLALVAFVAGQALGRRPPGPATSAIGDQVGSSLPVPARTASDISNLSPEERTRRLFKRVMRYSEQGKMDSARFFAPMAIQAYQMAGPLDAHARYDIGEISVAVGEVAMARLQADSILAAQPKHLLGLALATRAAAMDGDSAAAESFRRRLVAAAPAERTRGLEEYTEHGGDIDEVLKKAGESP